MNRDPYLVARKLHDAADRLFPPATTTPAKFDDLSPEAKERWARLARIAHDSSPAPIILDVKHLPSFPRQGVSLLLYSDITKAGIDETVQRFRAYLEERVDEWKREHAEPET